MTDLPKGWEWSTLDELTDPLRPICYGILMPKDNVADGVPYVKVKDFPLGTIDVAGLHRTAPSIAEKYSRSSLRPDDVLVSIRGTYGRVTLVPPELDGANITQDTARVSPAPGVLPKFVAYFLRSDIAQSYFKEVARGVAVKGVNIGDLRLLPVPLPPTAEQDRVVGIVEEHLSQLDTAERQLRSAAARLGYDLQPRRGGGPLRRAILARAFTGGLTSSHDEDEPASTLLNRLREARASAPASRTRAPRR